jgi:hypothetical protein
MAKDTPDNCALSCLALGHVIEGRWGLKKRERGKKNEGIKVLH